MTKVRTWTTTFALACATLASAACELRTSMSPQQAPSGQFSTTGTAGIFSPKGPANKQTMPGAMGAMGTAGMLGGESGSLAKLPGNASKPAEAGSGAMEAKSQDDKPGTPSASTLDAGGAASGSHAGGGPVTSKAGMSASDAGAADAQASGAPAVAHKGQPEAAGSDAMAPPQAPQVPQMSSAPIAGAPSTMAACTPAFPGASCDTAPQCGCNQGENCAYLSIDIPACVPAGAAGLNQACSLSTDCQVGLQCIAGACLQLCEPNQPGCGDGVACNQNYTSTNRPIPGYFTCSSHCSLVDPQRATQTFAACGSGLTCVVFGGGADCARSASKRIHGEACESSTDCAPGYSCTDNGTCARWCETQNECADGYWCEMQNVTVGDTRYGLCRPSCADMREVACDVASQCGCDGNMACDFTSDGGRSRHVCREVGRTAPYARCDRDEECGSGTSCVGGRCAPFCDRDSQCGGTYARCVQVTDGSLSTSPSIPGFHVCRRPCDPADTTRPHGAYQSCPAGYGCSTSTDGESWCHETNSQGEWRASCDGASDCAVGYECSTRYGCALQCQSNSDCNTGFLCSAFEPATFADVQAWGICVPTQENTQ